MSRWPALLAGLVFGMGLALSGMTDTEKVLGFLDIGGFWDPDLAFVMGGALAVTLSATPIITSRAKPFFAASFQRPLSTQIDGRLVGGGALFGLGWGLWGYCPGPAIAAIAYGHTETLVFIIAMLAGMWLAGQLGLVKPRSESE